MFLGYSVWYFCSGCLFDFLVLAWFGIFAMWGVARAECSVRNAKI